MDWTELKPALDSEIINLLTENGFETPTEVQIETIPQFLTRKDVAVEAITGSGKTLAFIVPTVQMLLHLEEKLKPNQLGALVIEPTRELAMQTFSVAKPFATKCNLSLGLQTGGSSTEAPSEWANITVGTPGRLAELLTKQNHGIQHGVRSLEILILDETDRLYSLGQADSIRSIIAHLPKQRRTGLFSATLEETKAVLSEMGMRNLATIKIQANDNASNLPKMPEGLELFYAKLMPSEKFAFLLKFLQNRPTEKHILFFATCAAVEYFALILRKFLGEETPVLWLHGKIDKLSRREKVFNRFKSFGNSGGILISTDLMSRGVDFPDVDWVLQFDPPSNPATFVHRCGRTARLSNTGSAIVFLLPNEIEYVRFIERNQCLSVKAFDVGDISQGNILEEMRKMALNDRDIFEKSCRAFVSFVQFYRKHECSLIFQLKELDLGQLAYSYGLLVMPRMPEIRSTSHQSFEPVKGLNLNEISYRDRGREKQRIEGADKKRDKIALRKEERQKQRAEQQRSKSFKKTKKSKKRKLKQVDNDSDWAELARDAKLIKRLKNGKMSEKEFERALGISSDEGG